MGFLSRWLGTTGSDRGVIGDLLEAYRGEAEHAARLRQHAAHARYPQVAAALRALAEMEDRHASLLRDRILELGGGVPPVAPVEPVARNQWQRAVSARQEAQRKRRRLVELVSRCDPDHPSDVSLLRGVEREDAAALETYEGLVMRADPHALD